jgi:HPt (histidine-containing phosphotransfer) domain-containing protein
MDKDEFRRQMEVFSAEYRASLPGKLAEVDALWTQIADGAQQPDTCSELLRRLHTLAGSAKTFGFPDLGTAARTAETFLAPYCRDGLLPQDGDRHAFSRLLAALRQSAAV